MHKHSFKAILISLVILLLVSCAAGPTADTSAATPTPDLKQMAEDAIAAVEKSEEENLTETELAIYNEVMDALDAEPNRAEEDIFDELAPQYGMTGSELKEFILTAMEKVYG